jgi:hypothetical protein
MSHARLAALTAAVTLAAIVVLSLITASSGGGRRPTEQDRALVESATRQLTHETVAGAWTQTRLGNTAELDAIKRQVPLRFLAAHQEADAVIVTFEGRGGGCVDFVSQPDASTVRTRRC